MSLLEVLSLLLLGVLSLSLLEVLSLSLALCIHTYLCSNGIGLKYGIISALQQSELFLYLRSTTRQHNTDITVCSVCRTNTSTDLNCIIPTNNRVVRNRAHSTRDRRATKDIFNTFVFIVLRLSPVSRPSGHTLNSDIGNIIMPLSNCRLPRTFWIESGLN